MEPEIDPGHVLTAANGIHQLVGDDGEGRAEGVNGHQHTPTALGTGAETEAVII
jgi:hypothetical protein